MIMNGNELEGFYSWRMVQFDFRNYHTDDVMFIVMRRKHSMDVWIRENCTCGHETRFHVQNLRLRYWFESKEEAFAFKMVWG